MLEKDFQRMFNRWCKYNWLKTAKFELKLVKGKSFPYNRLVKHQRDGLKAPKIAYKLPDSDRSPKPFDSVFLFNVQGYVVIIYYVPRKPKVFYIIKIQDFESWEMRSRHKSITADECRNIAIIGSELKS